MLPMIREKTVGIYKIKQHAHTEHKNINSVTILGAANREMHNTGLKEKEWCNKLYHSLSSMPAVERFLKQNNSTKNVFQGYATNW